MWDSIITIFWEFFDPEFRDHMFRLGISVICGFIVGFQRGYRGKPAGIRTNILICTGSCLLMLVSYRVAADALQAGVLNADPARIAAQIVSGIGFLGAGAILSNRGMITGLTSAAGIWSVAAIGMAIGAGMEKVGLVSALGVVAVAEVFSHFTKIFRMQRYQTAKLEVIVKKETRIQSIRQQLRKLSVIATQENMERIVGEVHYQARIYFRGDIEKQIEQELTDIRGVKEVIFLDHSVE